VDASGLALRLFRFYPPLDRGINVYKMPDGTYTQSQPMYLSNPDAQNLTDIAQMPVATYYGGHSYQVSDAEATALTAAGYGVYLTAPQDDPNQAVSIAGTVPYGYSGQTSSTVPVTPPPLTSLP
jgi:hypothetical protein